MRTNRAQKSSDLCLLAGAHVLVSQGQRLFARWSMEMVGVEEVTR